MVRTRGGRIVGEHSTQSSNRRALNRQLFRMRQRNHMENKRPQLRARRTVSGDLVGNRRVGIWTRLVEHDRVTVKRSGTRARYRPDMLGLWQILNLV